MAINHQQHQHHLLQRQRQVRAQVGRMGRQRGRPRHWSLINKVK
jgi:hypothetical protein